MAVMRKDDTVGRLGTQRLTLTPVRLEHADAMALGIGDPDVARMLADCPLPFTSAMAKDWLKQSERDWRSGRAHVWSIFEAHDFIGMISVDARADGGRDLGYWIRKPRWGAGLATEAARRVVDFAFLSLDSPFLAAGHFTDNPASARVLKRLGFIDAHLDRQWCAARREHVPHQHMTLSRRAWLK